jgi:lipid A 3-O-deacylase
MSLPRPTRPKTMKARRLLAASLLLATPHAAVAQSGSFLPDYGDGYLTFYLDNDLFSGSDQDYTSGARLSWISGNRPIAELARVQRFLRSLSGDGNSVEAFRRLSGFEDASQVSYNYGFSLTQLMFTPEDPAVFGLIADDRPYAGVLLVGLSLHAKDENVLNSISINVGTVGPHAYAEQTQDFIHSIRGVEKFNGWDNQVPNEALFNLYLNQKRRLALLEYESGMFAIDGFNEVALGLGNYRTEAQFGTVMRIGFNLPIEFSDPRLSPYAYSHKLFQSDEVQNSFWSLYTMFGAKGYAVVHDVTLDGPMFRDDFSTSVDREPFVGEVFAGFGARLSDWEFSYAHTFRTKEYQSQDGSFSFGSIAIRKSF